MNDDEYYLARVIAQTLLRRALDASRRPFEPGEIENAVRRALVTLDADAVDADRLVADLERSFQTLIEIGRAHV